MIERVIVIGAGVTGLATAWKLVSCGIPVTIIEKEKVVGGLAGSVDWDGWKFDYGPHNFHTYDEEIINFYKEILPGDFIERKPNVKVFIFNKLISYPLMGTDVFLSLSGTKMAQAFVDFLFTRSKAFFYGMQKTEYLDEWIKLRFGRILYETYFGPYIQRIWKTDPHKLSKTMGELKIPVLSIRNFIKREIFKNNRIDPNDLSHWKSYYVKGGVGQISGYLAKNLIQSGDAVLKIEEEVDSIEVGHGRINAINTSRGRIDASSAYVVSTIPLNILMQKILNAPKETRLRTSLLEYCSERFFFMRINKPRVSGFDWTYFSENKYPFNRVSEFTFDQLKMVPYGYSSLTFEFPCNIGDWEWVASDDEIVNAILPLYNEVFGLKREEIIDYRSVFQNYAYPRYAIGYEAALKDIFNYIGKIDNLCTAGRQGAFCYLNLDGATRMGLDIAEEIIIHKKPEKKYAELLKKYHNIK